MKVFIDGDGSPVKETSIEIAQRFPVSIVIVTTWAHYTAKEYSEMVEVVYVDQGPDAADYRIAGMIQKGDILVTQDYGLAALVLPKKATVLHHTGRLYTADTLPFMLEQRHHQAQIRQAKGRTKGPKPFTEAERTAFAQQLTTLLTERFT